MRGQTGRAELIGPGKGTPSLYRREPLAGIVRLKQCHRRGDTPAVVIVDDGERPAAVQVQPWSGLSDEQEDPASAESIQARRGSITVAGFKKLLRPDSLPMQDSQFRIHGRPQEPADRPAFGSTDARTLETRMMTEIESGDFHLEPGVRPHPRIPGDKKLLDPIIGIACTPTLFHHRSP